MLRDAEIPLLHNRSVARNVRDEQLSLVGVGDLWAAELDPERGFRDAKRHGPVVLMSHNPDSKEMVRRFDWDLMISGHTHGGQVIVPFEGPKYAPVVDMRFVKGLHAWDDRQIYVSRGVGNLGRVRFMCRPEVAILDLVPRQRV